MSISARVTRRPRRTWPPVARLAATIIAPASLALLATACGGSPSSTSPAGFSNAQASPSSQALNFARCMRSHGVQHWPDPTSSGTFDKSELTPQQLGVTTSQVRTAGQACQHLLPYNGGATQAEAQQLMNSMRNFARCMRSHGVSNWPDPVPDQHLGGLPGFPRNMPGINQNSPRITTDIDGCRHLIPGASGLPPGGYP